ncbi:MAG: tetratricopeptide repeat protein [Planctomycetes bacterium]|nr:tetratricopeptide repeat protein [Planctomycetota bacterium]
MKHLRWFAPVLLAPVVAAASWISHERPAAAGGPVARDVSGPLALGAVDTQRGLPARAKEDPAIAEKRLRVSQALQKHEFRRVPALVDDLRKLAPRDLWSMGALSDALVEMGEIEKAEQELQRFMDIKPCAASYTRAAWLLHLRGDASRAEETMALAWECFQAKDIDARAWVQSELGDLAWQRGDLDAARARFEAGLRVKPGHVASLAGLARIKAAKGDFAGAASDLEAIADNPMLFSELAFVQRKAGNPDLGEFDLRRGRQLGDLDPLSARSLSLLLSDHGLDPERAVQLAQGEVAARPGIHSWDALAWAFCGAKKFDEAWEAALRATAFGTEEPVLLFHAGMAAAGSGHPGEARRLLGRTLELNPSFHPAFADLARATLATLEEKSR